jgi:hypothetical protein
MSRRFRFFALPFVLVSAVWVPSTHAQSIVPDLEQEIRQRVAQIESKLIAWRRDIHEHPELGEQETRTSGLVAAHLTSLGLEVKTGVGGTGVVAILKGGKPGPMCAGDGHGHSKLLGHSQDRLERPSFRSANDLSVIEVIRPSGQVS